MSQKYEALEKYTQLKADYNSITEWVTLETVSRPLVRVGEEMPSSFDAFIDANVEQLKHDIQRTWAIIPFPLFVRACPLIPRPGVLESSKANHMDEVDTIARRIMTTMMSPDPSDKPMYDHGFIDPHGTVIVQPFIDAKASAVVAPDNYIIMGRDNDGVTAGKKGLRVAIPLGKDDCTERDLLAIGLHPSTTQIEFVSKPTYQDCVRQSYPTCPITQRHAMVQLRGCEGHDNIVPAPRGVTINGTFHGAERITIKHIHLVSDYSDEQLDKMEQALREGMPEGTVVLHPPGSHLSHHAGQCFKYGVPYIASAEPQVGEQWTQAAPGWVVLDNEGNYEPQPYNPLDYTQDFISGFQMGFSNFGRQQGWLSNIFHQFVGGPLLNPAESAYLGGAFVAWLINGSLSVSLGELRHLFEHAQDATILHYATLAATYGVDAWEEVSSHHFPTNRKHYYMTVENHPITIESAIALFEFAEDCYSLPWSSSYGGEKYKKASANARLLLESVSSFIDNPSDESFKSLTGLANEVEHAVHNTGYFFNKFISKTALDWGTDPAKVSIEPTAFFSVYYAAQDIMKSGIRMREDFTDVLSLYRSYELKELHAKPLSEHDNPIGKAVTYLTQAQRHPNGKYSVVGKPSFLYCGVDSCQVCKTAQHAVSQQTSSMMFPIQNSYEAHFPVDNKKKDETVLAFKSLKAMYDDATQDDKQSSEVPAMLAMLMKGKVPVEAEKYISYIVSNFTSTQLQEFSKLQKGDE